MIRKDGGGVIKAAMRRVLGSPQPGDPGRRPHQRTVTHPCAPRSGVPERAALGEHDARVELAQALIGKPKRRKRSRLEVGEHGVGARDELLEYLRARRMPQVQAQAILVAVSQRPRPAHHLTRRRLAQPVGIRGALDLDDLCSEVGEQAAQLPARHDHAEVEDPHPVERPTRRTGYRRRLDISRRPGCFGCTEGRRGGVYPAC